MEWQSILGIAVHAGYNSLIAAFIALVFGLVGKTNPKGTAKGRRTPTWRAAMLAYREGLTGLLQKTGNKPASWGRGKVLLARFGAWIMADTVDDKNVVSLTKTNLIAGILAATFVIGTPVVTSFSYVLNLKFAVDSLKQTQDAMRQTSDGQQKLIEKLIDASVESKTQNATLSAKVDQVLGRLK